MLRRDEVADRCGVSTRTVDNWIASGALTAFRRGRVVRVGVAELDRFLAENPAA